ncbi:MAG: thioredoxin domain-containing protein, partial [Rhodoferax sp.]|nr:thioredoxin domain-containing protein [Rhodoferax sp.]
AMMTAHPDKIRLTMRYAPFHPGSESVVKVLEASRKQDKFETTLEALFAGQDRWVINHTSHVEMTGPILESTGMDMARLQNDANAPAVAAMIARDLADAKTMNVTMTPEY